MAIFILVMLALCFAIFCIVAVILISEVIESYNKSDWVYAILWLLVTLCVLIAGVFQVAVIMNQ